MGNDPEREKLDDLAARIHEAGVKTGDKQTEGAAADLKAGNIGYELLGTVLACAIVGWLIDRYMHTRPWGLLVMLVAGFVAGIANVWRVMNGYDQSVGLRKQDKNKE